MKRLISVTDIAIYNGDNNNNLASLIILLTVHCIEMLFVIK